MCCLVLGHLWLSVSGAEDAPVVLTHWLFFYIGIQRATNWLSSSSLVVSRGASRKALGYRGSGCWCDPEPLVAEPRARGLARARSDCGVTHYARHYGVLQ